MAFWQEIYTQFNPIAFELFGLKVHWYGLMYVTALLVAIWMAKYIVKKDKIPLNDDELDNYIFWAEIGIIFGARIGYIVFYSPERMYYLTHPWQMFNPYVNGSFVGISGMSYHGAIIGFLLASTLYANMYRIKVWTLLDIIAIAAPIGFIFGRIGNFLNQELVGRVSDVPWAIKVGELYRHPSQLYEAFFEGLIVFMIIFLYRSHKRFEGELIALYGILYSIARFGSEFFRQPDVQLGYVCCDWMSMGQLMSLFMLLISMMMYYDLSKNEHKSVFK